MFFIYLVWQPLNSNSKCAFIDFRLNKSRTYISITDDQNFTVKSGTPHKFVLSNAFSKKLKTNFVFLARLQNRIFFLSALLYN